MVGLGVGGVGGRVLRDDVWRVVRIIVLFVALLQLYDGPKIQVPKGGPSF